MLSNTNWDSSSRLKLFSLPGKQPVRKRAKGSAASPCSLAQEDLIFKWFIFYSPPAPSPSPSSLPLQTSSTSGAFLPPISLRSEELCHQSPTETYFQRSALTQKSLGTAPSEQRVPALLRGESHRDRIQDVGPSAKHLSGSHISERNLYAADLVTGECIYKTTHEGQAGWLHCNTMHGWAEGPVLGSRLSLLSPRDMSRAGGGCHRSWSWGWERHKNSVLGMCYGMKVYKEDGDRCMWGADWILHLVVHRGHPWGRTRGRTSVSRLLWRRVQIKGMLQLRSLH